MRALIEYSTGWEEVAELIKTGRSGILISPRHYGKWASLHAYRKLVEGDLKQFVSLSSRVPALGADIDYLSLWENFAGQLGKVPKRSVVDRSGFLRATRDLLNRRSGHHTVLIGGAGRGHEESHFRVISLFQQLISTQQLSIVAIDDYSSFYYQKANYLLSDLHSLEMIQIGPSRAKHISRYVEARREPADISKEYIQLIIEQVLGRSGGHTGLAQELLHALELSTWPEGEEEIAAVLDAAISNSTVLEHIGHALEEDTEGYTSTALEYRVPAIPEKNTVRVQVLRQLGVLQRREPPLLVLCSGAITRIVEELHHSTDPQLHRLGSVVNETGPRLYEEGPVVLDEDDLVLLHISDLHVGDNYRFRLSWPGGQLNPNELSAGELIREDLVSLGLYGRVDAILLTGDFVWNGKAEEFRRAREVVKDICESAGIDPTKLVMIPGNHDVEWSPGSLASRSYGKAVSRESFDDFVSLVCGATYQEVVELILTSRSGKHQLQILGLDSNRVEGPNAAGTGFISRDNLTQARTLVRNYRDKCVESASTWMTVHHHVFPATSSRLGDAEVGRVSTMANSADILDFATEANCEMILHGHEHQPCITVARRWPADSGSSFSPTVSVGAGSFGVKREYLGPFSRNQYFVLIRRPNGILLRSRAQGGAGLRFVSHSDIWLPR